MNCLDTYALWELHEENPSYRKVLEHDAVVNEITFSEFYSLLYARHGMRTAEYWHRKLEPWLRPVPREVILKAVCFRIDNKKENLSFFDCVGYIFALEQGMRFVTGDRAFKGRKCVLYIP